MVILFWLCVGLILWVYAGYPLLLWVMHLLRPARHAHGNGLEPEVTLVISAYNEAGVIRQKIENSLALDYARHKLDIVVISDCSDDGTDAIVQYAQLGSDGPTGGYFDRHGELPW